MSSEIRHIRQVKAGSLTRAVALDIVWAGSLDEMQMVIYALIDVITGEHHEHIRSIVSKRVEMRSLLNIATKILSSV